MQTPIIDMRWTTYLFPNGQANTTPWIGKLQMEENTLPKGDLYCPTNAWSVVNEPMCEKNTFPIREGGKGVLEMLGKREEVI